MTLDFSTMVLSLDSQSPAPAWVEALKAELNRTPRILYVPALGEFLATLKGSECVALVVFAKSFTPNLEKVLLAFQGQVGSVDGLVCVITREEMRPYALAQLWKFPMEHLGIYSQGPEVLQDFYTGIPEGKIREAGVYQHLQRGNIEEAVRLLDTLPQIGPHLMSLLNDCGVTLSQSGHIATALLLYAKAHAISPAPVRYQITLNTALACYRAENYPLALEYVARCKDEYGGSFAKLEKVEQGIRTAILQK